MSQNSENTRGWSEHQHGNVFSESAIAGYTPSVKLLAENRLPSPAEKTFIALVTWGSVDHLDERMKRVTVFTGLATHLSPTENSSTFRPIAETTPTISCPGISYTRDDSLVE